MNNSKTVENKHSGVYKVNLLNNGVGNVLTFTDGKLTKIRTHPAKSDTVVDNSGFSDVLTESEVLAFNELNVQVERLSDEMVVVKFGDIVVESSRHKLNGDSFSVEAQTNRNGGCVELNHNLRTNMVDVRVDGSPKVVMRLHKSEMLNIEFLELLAKHVYY